MSYESGKLNASLAAAVGDDLGLIAELRDAFIDSARRDIDLLARARCDANWRIAAWRLQGLCASFGVEDMMELARQAERSAPGDPVVVRRLRAALSTLSGQE